MVDGIRFLPAGTGGLLIELNDLETTLTLLDAMKTNWIDGVIDLVPAASTLLVRFDISVTDARSIVSSVSKMDRSSRTVRTGETFEIPVIYDGEDLEEVAALLGWTTEEVIRRHTATTYTVAFTGFAPGFAYMTCDDPAFDVPRRKSPRVRIPAGSVALGGRFGGIYPADSPGGWQLLGRTPLKMWDIDRDRAALLSPGDRVRFCDIGADENHNAVRAPDVAPLDVDPVKTASGLHVTRADRPALFEDLGRPGLAAQGVSVSGALDRASLIEANLCVGNPRGATAIEIAYGGFAVRAYQPVTLAVTGASSPLTIRTLDGRSVSAPFATPFAMDAGEELIVDFPEKGTRSYLAIRGGFLGDKVLGSASTDTLAKVGPAPVTVGDTLVPDDAPAIAVDPHRPKVNTFPQAGNVVSLDVLIGPRSDWFTKKGLETLVSQDWLITAESSRIGVRLAGKDKLEKATAAELPSEGTPIGAIQVPHSGQPVLFLADHPLTGGYPVIAVVAHHHLDLAGQIPIGASIRFNAIGDFEPLISETTR